MKSRFSSTNFFAILIAIILITIGFVLLFIHKQSEEDEAVAASQVSKAAPVEASTAENETLAEIALIHAAIGQPMVESPIKTEFELVRESIDWSGAPSPAPERVDTANYDVFINVSKEFLDYFFTQVGYTGEMIDAGKTSAVPPVLIVSVPKGWADDISVQFKKSMFYRTILSLVLYENDAVLRERETLLAILESRDQTGSLTAQQQSILADLARSYRVIGNESDATIDTTQIAELLTRVDMVPPSLALAQAAHESGYATSRFAHTGNALFGQWDWGANAIKPEQQRTGMGSYGIKAFDQPIDSVRSYIMNLNSHRAYAGFRAARAEQRGDKKGRIVLDGKSLADTLTSYSERGTDYTEELKGTISYNRLERADGLRLMEGEPIYIDGKKAQAL